MSNDLDDDIDSTDEATDLDESEGHSVEGYVTVAIERPEKSKRVSTRARTIAPKELMRAFRKRSQQPEDEESSYPEETERPVTRADCLAGGVNEMRPCPYVSCAHHLYIDVNKQTGAIKLNFPNFEPWDLKETCELDVADRGGVTLEEVGAIMNLTRERIRQVEVKGLLKAGFEHEIRQGCRVCSSPMEEVDRGVLPGDNGPTPVFGRLFACAGCDREIEEPV